MSDWSSDVCSSDLFPTRVEAERIGGDAVAGQRDAAAIARIAAAKGARKRRETGVLAEMDMGRVAARIDGRQAARTGGDLLQPRLAHARRSDRDRPIVGERTGDPRVEFGRAQRLPPICRTNP